VRFSLRDTESEVSQKTIKDGVKKVKEFIRSGKKVTIPVVSKKNPKAKPKSKTE
jgi:hypothetical protein